MGRLHQLIRYYFGEHNRKVQVVRSRNGDHIAKLARCAVEEGTDTVVAVGGDGTVNLIARHLVNSPTILGVIPTGSGNGLARNLKIPLRLNRALISLKEPNIISIDVGKVRDNTHKELIFLVSCGIGWEGVIATVFESSRIRGILPYATAALTTYLQYEPQIVEVKSETDGWRWSGRPMLFTVANMKEYGVNATIAPQAKFDDGRLDLCLIPRQSLIDAIKYTPEIFRQRPDAIPGYLHYSGEIFSIQRELSGNISVDGSPEFVGEHIKIEVLSSALKVAVPQS